MICTSQRGISLFQGIFALAVISVMALCTAPHYYRFLGDRYVVAYTNELVGALHQARRLAVNNMSPVSLCSSSNGRDCTQTPWNQGYIAFFDAGQSGVVDGIDRIVHAVQPRKTPIRVVLQGADHIRFQSNGGVLVDSSPTRGHRHPAAHSKNPTALASLLNAFSPIATAHAVDTVYPASLETALPVAFLVCGGQIGRTIRVTAIGRVDTSTVACH
ncbi:MAG TPA: GspH/FimT family pseudopilin [Acidiferrobacterales bacterium]|nr:GspH/FimT family pseudopilin [Acidiferrobacterales bacterium]